MMQKRIPTVMGLGLLVVALVVGVIFIGQGPGVFAPRATPQTTPKKIKVTNVTDNSFTISFLTDEKTAGFVKYGTEASDLKSQSSDDRDQLSGNVGEYQLHHVTVRGLQENTSYYYELGTGSGATFDNNGNPFTIKTAKRSGAPSAAKTVYGSVTNPSGGPADGSVVFVSLDGAGEMSSLVKNSGSWAIPLSNARTPDGSAYATISDTANLTIMVQGTTETLTTSTTIAVSEAQPVPSLALGSSGGQPVANQNPVSTSTPTASVVPIPVDSITSAAPTGSASSSGGLANLNNQPLATDSALVTEVNVEEGDGQEVAVTQPTIKGKAAPQVVISIEVNSETQITTSVTADENGEFELDLSQFEDELEPGEHTVTYSYNDPNTGELVTKTVTFFVAQSATKQLAQAETTQPFGSGNPFPATTPTPTATASATPSATPATASSEVSTRSAMPSTASGVPVSGSVGTTMALAFGGLFFIASGIWSFWISSQLAEERRHG